MNSRSWMRLGLLALLLAAPSYAADAELYISPTRPDSAGRIYRSVVFHATVDGAELVRLAECDTLVARCRRNGTTARIRREMPYRDYLYRLARWFKVDLRMLENHNAALETYRETRTDLQALIDDEQVPEAERRSARVRFDALTGRGGILERFNRALAVKQSLEAGVDIRHGDTNERYKETVWPLNFVADKPDFRPWDQRQWASDDEERSLANQDQAAENRRFHRALDLGTGLTWKVYPHYRTANLAEANTHCGTHGRGYRLPSFADIRQADEWLYLSAVGQAVPAETAGQEPGGEQKKIWLNPSERSPISHRGSEYQSFGPNQVERLSSYNFYYSYLRDHALQAEDRASVRHFQTIEMGWEAYFPPYGGVQRYRPRLTAYQPDLETLSNGTAGGARIWAICVRNKYWDEEPAR